MDQIKAGHGRVAAPSLNLLWLHVNGQVTPWTGDPATLLHQVLHVELGLIGKGSGDTGFGCPMGHRGASALWMDGQMRCAWALTVAEAAGRALRTMPAASLRQNSGQCCSCQPGMITTALALLDEHPEPTDAQLAIAMNKLCQCEAKHASPPGPGPRALGAPTMKETMS